MFARELKLLKHFLFPYKNTTTSETLLLIQITQQNSRTNCSKAGNQTEDYKSK